MGNEPPLCCPVCGGNFQSRVVCKVVLCYLCKSRSTELCRCAGTLAVFNGTELCAASVWDDGNRFDRVVSVKEIQSEAFPALLCSLGATAGQACVPCERSRIFCSTAQRELRPPGTCVLKWEQGLWKYSLNPVFDGEGFNPAEFAFVVGDQSGVFGEGVGGD